MIFHRRICLAFFFFTSLCTYGQTDSTYIGSFRQIFSIRASFYQKFTALSHLVEEGKEVNYTPNKPVGIGLGVQYKNFSLAGGVSFDFLRDKKRGKTQSLDFQYHYYGRKFIADFFFQRYKGFYVAEKTGKGKDEEIIHLHPDISLVQYGVNGEYVFNNKKFSYRAAFQQHEKQLKSAGSFQLGGGFYYNRISGDSALVVNNDNLISGYQLSLNAGYAYTFVISRHFFASAGLSVGINLGTERLDTFFKSVEVTPSIYPRVSVGYNGDSWSIGVNAVMNRMGVSRTGGMDLFVETGRMNVCFIKRFESAPAFLRKIKFLNKD